MERKPLYLKHLQLGNVVLDLFQRKIFIWQEKTIQREQSKK